MDWCEFRLTFSPLGVPLPAGFHGSMLRGAFGHSLRWLACVMRRADCAGCPLEQGCIYTSIFEPRVPSTARIMTKYPRGPNPFVLIVEPVGHADSDRIRVGLRLFGPAIAQHALMLHAFEEAATRGFGPARRPYRLDEVAALDAHGAVISAMPIIRGMPDPVTDIAEWDVATPLRLTVAGRPMSPDRVDASAIAMGILRRTGLMHSFYAPAVPLPDFQQLKASSVNLRLVRSDLSWFDLMRRSSRQKATQSISGLVGRIGIDCREAPEWGRWLAWGPILHLGKNTSMGLGRLVAA